MMLISDLLQPLNVPLPTDLLSIKISSNVFDVFDGMNVKIDLIISVYNINN